MATKFANPFSGASDLDIGGRDEARKGDPFPSDQEDESRNGAMRGFPKYADVKDMTKMRDTAKKSSEGFSVWEKMEII